MQKKKLDMGFQKIPRKLIFDSSISDRARFLYCYMAAKPEGWSFFLEPMAEELGYNIKTLKKYIEELVKAKWIEKSKQKREGGLFSSKTFIISSIPREMDDQKMDDQKMDDQKMDDQKMDDQKMDDQKMDDQKMDSNNRIDKDNIDKERKNKEEETSSSLGRKRSSKAFVKPTIEELEEYIKEKGYHFDAESFFAFYESKGWMIGKNPMKNWRMACVTWEKGRGFNSFNDLFSETKQNEQVVINGQIYR